MIIIIRLTCQFHLKWVARETRKSAESESSTLKCTRIGCSEVFRWRMQLKRHPEVCDKPTPPDGKDAGYEASEDGFICSSCGKKSD